MNENINLTKILKDCPKGTKLYSTVYGEVSFVSINDDLNYPIAVELSDKEIEGFTTEGKLSVYYNGECTLFPSREQRDWSKFTAPWYKKESNTIEQTQPQTNERAWLYLVSDVLTWKDGIGQYLDDPRVQEIAKRLCNKYAQKLYNPSVIEDKKPKNKVTEPSYRPFKNKDECWHEMQKHSPFGWLYHKKDNSYTPLIISIENVTTNFAALFNHYRFVDGTPFGIKEE